MNRDETIGSGSYTLRRDEVLDAMLEQRDASAKVIESRTWLWRKLKLLSIVVIVPAVVIGIALDRAPWIQIGLALLFSFGAVFQFSEWRIKRIMNGLGASRVVPRKTVIKTLDKRIFKGRDSIRGEAIFGEEGFELMQDDVAFSATYDDEQKVGFILERHGMLEIILAESRKLPDLIFMIPLARLSNPDAVLRRVRQSPMFLFTTG